MNLEYFLLLFYWEEIVSHTILKIREKVIRYFEP